MKKFITIVGLLSIVAVSFFCGKEGAYGEAELRWTEKEAFNAAYVVEVGAMVRSIEERFNDLAEKNNAKDRVIAELRAYLRLENLIVPKRHDKFLNANSGIHTGVGGN